MICTSVLVVSNVKCLHNAIKKLSPNKQSQQLDRKTGERSGKKQQKCS
uniref:Uncharacterized protein n=1 Tax=Rhizophora mucronata TaxID=61149 RepID=A0A2P2PUS0_RHIMU